MPLSVASPGLLVIGLLLAGATLLLSRAARHHLSLGRRRASIGLRLVVLAALVLALAGLRLEAPVDRLTTVFVVDLSDSVGAAGDSGALDFVRRSLAERRDPDLAAVVAFGGEALVERLPGALSDLDRLASVPARSATDVGAALRLSAALFPDETQKRIVLVSDGNDTTGQGQSEAALAAARGVRIDTFEVGQAGADEVILERLHTPAVARVGEVIEAEVTISSTVAQAAAVRLYADGAQVATPERLDLAAGLTRVTFEIKAAEPGFHTFRAVVEAARDTFRQNDRADSDTVVKGDPHILLVSDDPLASDHLAAALAAERQDVDVVRPDDVPTDLAALAGYDSVVLVDVAAEQLGPARLDALQSLVRDVGRGLVMVGGEDSYGAGGYARTALEDTLPVEMDVRDRTRLPDVAMVVVIDRSGSMDACHCNTANRDRGSAIAGVPKVDIGKEAILRAVAALTERDEFGVVAFNENAHWIVDTAPLGEAGDIGGRLGAIRAEGQTNIFAGLSAAVESLEKTSAERRHIVLLTDGWSSSGEYEDLLRRMKAANITLSAVGAGGGGAGGFLAELARSGGGRYWPAVNPASIPDIFVKETEQASGEQIVEEAFFPVQTGDSPILRGLDTGLPRLRGYNGTTIKPTAQQVLATGRDDPLLAQWQYGLGRAVAWTSDATSRWATDWAAWGGFDRFFSQLVAWSFPGEESEGLEATFASAGDATRLRLVSAEADGTPRDFYDTTARVTSPGMEPLTVRLEQVAPGTYEADLGIISPGAYAIRVDQVRPGETPLGRTVVLVAPTPAEYRLLGTNERLLAALRGATGGRGLEGETAPRQAWSHDLAGTTAATELWPWLLIMAMLLWPLDVGVRRVSVGRRDLALAQGWAVARWSRWRGAAERNATASGMLAAKERATGARTRSTLLREEAAAAGPASAAASPAAPTGEASPSSAPPPGEPIRPPVGPPPGRDTSDAAGRAQERPSTGSSGTGRAGTPTIPATGDDDTLARLRQAKDRARRG